MRRTLAADRTFRIAPEIELAKLHLQRIEMEQPAEQRFADAEDEFQRFSCLNRPDDAGKHAEHTRLRAARHRCRLGWLGKKAAVTGPAEMRREDRRLAVEAKNRAVNVRLPRENGDVVREVARGKIIAPIHHEVVICENLLRVRALEAALVQTHVDMRIHLAPAVGAPTPPSAGRRRSCHEAVAAGDSRAPPDRNPPDRSCRRPPPRGKVPPENRGRRRRRRARAPTSVWPARPARPRAGENAANSAPFFG